MRDRANAASQIVVRERLRTKSIEENCRQARFDIFVSIHGDQPSLPLVFSAGGGEGVVLTVASTDVAVADLTYSPRGALS